MRSGFSPNYPFKTLKIVEFMKFIKESEKVGQKYFKYLGRFPIEI